MSNIIKSSDKAKMAAALEIMKQGGKKPLPEKAPAKVEAPKAEAPKAKKAKE